MKLVAPRKTGPSHSLLFQEEPILVLSDTQLLEVKKSYKRNQKIKFLCESCKKYSIKQLRSIESFCLKCNICNNSLKNTDVREKARQTKLEKYGSETWNNQEKRKDTILKKYGSFDSIASHSAKNRKAHTYRNPSFEKYIQEKRKNTILKKYGSQEEFNKIVSEKCKKTKET